MSSLSKNTEQKYLLNGVQYNAPEGWEDVTIEANYENDNVQPSLTVSDFTFNLEARNVVNDWFHGNIGGFEGMPFELILYNNQSQQVSFKAFLDFYSNYEELLEDGKINTSIVKEESIDDLYSKLESLTYGYLEGIGAIGQGDYLDCPYVVEKKFNLFEIVMTATMTYLMVKELAEAVANAADAIASVTSLALFVGVGSTALGAALLAVLKALILIAYAAAILIAVINLSKQLMEALVPPKRTHKVIKLRTALEKVVDYLGYTLEAPAKALDVYYLPSNPRTDEKKADGFLNFAKGTPSGIPNVVDYGYHCSDMFNLAKTLINGKIALINGVVHIRAKGDSFWQQQSTWSLPDVLIESKRYNLNELKSTKVIQFKLDQNDEWTIDNFKGTAYEIKTTPITVQNSKAVLLKGLEEVKFNVALGSRKNELNAIENLLKTLGGLIDKTTGVFGGGTSFAAAIKSRLGVLKVTNNWHTVPKLLPLKGTKLPLNHSTLFNSKVLWNDYLSYDSFVKNGYKRQRAIYNDVTIPFGIEDFKQLTKNPFFKFKGNTAKIIKFAWTTGKDTANVSFWVQETYTTNLQETFIEAE